MSGLPPLSSIGSTLGAGSSKEDRTRGPSPHHEPKLLPQSPQDSPVRGATIIRAAGPAAAFVTGAGASPVDRSGGGDEDDGGRGCAGSAAVCTWEIECDDEHGQGSARQGLVAGLAPAFLHKFIFGLGASFGFNALVVCNGTLMDYYGETLGLSTSFLSLADFLTGAATIYAAVGVGYLSDRSTSSWGRRKPYVVAFTPLLAFSIAMLFAPGLAPSPAAVPTWFATFYALEQVSMSALSVVVAAWGTSLTHSGAERASLYTVDAMMDLCGFLTGVVITSSAAGGAPQRRTGMALALIFLLQNFLLVCVLRDEPLGGPGASLSARASHHPQTAVPVPVPFIPGLHLCFQNAEYAKLFGAAAFGSIVGTTVNLLPIFLQVVMGVPGEEVGAVYGAYVQVVVAAALVAVLATGRLNARLGKVRTLQLGVACGAAYGVLAFLASYGRVGGFYVTAVPAGLCAGIALVNCNVLLSNAIDYDQLRTSFKRQSFMQCLIFVPITFVGVSGSAIPLSIITAFGGLEAQAADRAPPRAVVTTLRLWVSLVVTACLCVSYHFLSGLRITEKVQEEIARQLRLREGAEGAGLGPVDVLADHDGDGEQQTDSKGEQQQQQQQREGGDGAAAAAAAAEAWGMSLGAPASASMSASASASVSSATRTDVESAAEGARDPSWQPPVSSFLELNFSARELALLTIAGGKRWKLLTYGMDLVGAGVYSLLLLAEAIAAVQERDDLTMAEVLACLFLLSSGLVIYEGARLQAMREVHAMPDREVAKWARRRLTERRDGVSPSLLRNPFVLVVRGLIAHLVAAIAMIALLSSLA